MVTNKERHEVAARLRKIEPSSFGSLFDVWREIALAVNPGGGSYKTLPLELSCLIEPEPEETCEMYRDEYGVWHCKSCESGADKIMGSDGEMDEWCAS